MGDELAGDVGGLAIPGDDVELPADHDSNERSRRPDDFISGPEAGVPMLGRSEEEMSSGVVWALIFAIAFAIWWFTRSSGSQHSSSSGGGTSSRAKADAEEMRRKRLEALGARGGASQASAASATGLRQRTAAGFPGEVEAKAEEKESSASEEAPAAEEVASSHRGAAEATQGEVARPSSGGARAEEGVVVSGGLSTFAAQVRGILCGVSSSHKVEGLHSGMTVRELHEKITAAFGPEAVGARLRIHFNGQELSKMDRVLGSAGVVSGSHLQVMFINAKATPAKPPEKLQSGSAEATQRTSGSAAPVLSASSSAAPVLSTSSASSAVLPELNTEEVVDVGPFCIRVQGSFKGHTSVVIEGLVASMTVGGLQDRIIASFEATAEIGLRLFFMGKELKDPRARLGLLGLKDGSTLNALFAAGQGQPSQPSQVSNTAPSAAVGTSTSSADASASVTANLAAAAALVTPDAAWEAMAAVEEQLSRAEDPTAAEPVRQAATMLKQLLLTATHESNPALLQLAQTANPDLVKIWAFEPTRTHLVKLLSSGGSSSQGGSTTSST